MLVLPPKANVSRLFKEKPMRALTLLIAALALAATAGADPLGKKSALDPAWQGKTRAFFKSAIEIPSVMGRGNVPKVAALVAGELRAA
ncbi:MAG: hypothetical protein EBZ50_06425, partial [Alphaproteobacteria bacterium]|nr:hypothetical protein [Alphaproteobacteria bacterium]